MQPQTRYRPATEAERNSSEYRREVLTLKLGIWTKQLDYAVEIGNEKRIAECEYAVADLTAKLDAVRP